MKFTLVLRAAVLSAAASALAACAAGLDDFGSQSGSAAGQQDGSMLGGGTVATRLIDALGILNPAAGQALLQKGIEAATPKLNEDGSLATSQQKPATGYQAPGAPTAKRAVAADPQQSMPLNTNLLSGALDKQPIGGLLGTHLLPLPGLGL